MTENPTSGIDVSDLRAAYARRGLGQLSDAELAAAVRDVVAVPRRDEANSFVLHAPLELIARARLLPMITESARELARMHLVAISAQYEAFGPPNPAHEASGQTAEVLLAEAPDDVIARTGAAAHAPIFLSFLHELGAEAETFAPLHAPLDQNLNRRPDWRIRWFEHRDPARSVENTTDPQALFDALCHAPLLGPSENNFIHPLLMRVDESGLAAEILDPLLDRPNPDATNALLRVAALSMVHDSAGEAPYGWTHCLTLPQAVLGLGSRLTNPAEALQVAATQVLAFRASLGETELTDTSLIRPAEAAGLADRIETLATAAATSHDAHVVKYALATITAARNDPEAGELFLTAGERLLQVWADAGGDPTDPLA